MKEGDGWICRSKQWQVVVNPSEGIDRVDAAGPEMAEIRPVRPEARYRTEINVEGRASTEAIFIAAGTAQKIAFRLCGVFYEPQQGVLILPLSEGPLSSVGGLRDSGAPPAARAT